MQMERMERRRNWRRFVSYGLGAGLLVVIGLVVYAWQQGWLGARPQPAPARQVQGMEGTPAKDKGHLHAEGEGHEEAGVSKGTTEGLTLSPEEKANIGLKTAVAQLKSVEDARLINGVVKPHPDRVALVTSRVAGRAVGVHVNLGDRVQKGQDLADIQSVELEKVELELIQAENKMVLAKAELERIKGLVEKGIAAKRELIAAENQYNAALNEIEGLTRQLILLGLPEEEIKRIRREKVISTLHLHAPLAGTVVERNVTLGQTVEPNQPLFRLLDDSIMIVEGDAFEDTLPLLRKGQKVRVKVPAYPKQVFEGRITFISPTVDPQKRTVHIWAEIANPHGMLKQDLFADLSVVVGGSHKSVTIPVEALISAEGEDFVFVEKGGVFVRRDVEIGVQSNLDVEVKRGLEPGERVVTDGKRQLYTKYLMSRQGGAALGGHAH